MSSIELNKVCKSFGDVDILQDVSFKVETGEFIVFVGPSGCGKSTLLRLVAGLEDITAGELIMNGNVINDMPPVKRDVAMVFQSYALYPHMNTYENMAFGLRNLKISEEEIKQRVDSASDVLQIKHLMNAKPKDMSGGQRQRVAIGRTIVRKPKLFLFDEPLSNLDAALRVQMRIEMARLHKKLKTTMIYVTHDQVEAMTLADRIVVLNDGKVEQIGHPLELYEKPCNIFVAGFIGSPSMNFISCQVSAASDKLIKGKINNSQEITIDLNKKCSTPIKKGDTIIIGVRPENIGITQEHKNSIKVDGKLITLEKLGNTSYAYIETSKDNVITCQAKEFKGAKENVSVYFQAADCYIFNQSGESILYNS